MKKLLVLLLASFMLFGTATAFANSGTVQATHGEINLDQLSGRQTRAIPQYVGGGEWMYGMTDNVTWSDYSNQWDNHSATATNSNISKKVINDAYKNNGWSNAYAEVPHTKSGNKVNWATYDDDWNMY